MEPHYFEIDAKLSNFSVKELNDIAYKYKNYLKSNETKTCKLCGREVNSFSNSHTIPRSVLKRLTCDGRLNGIGSLLNNDYMKKSKGINKAETFFEICSSCEDLFSEYENGDLWQKLQDEKKKDRILLEIKVKNILHKIYIRENVLKIYYGMREELKTKSIMLKDEFSRMESTVQLVETEGFIKNNECDLNDWKNELNKYKKYIINKNKDCKNLFYIKFLKKLDYVAPIALQEDEYYIHDTLWNVISDVYDLQTSHRINGLSVCIFPQKASTIIMMFVEDNCRKYDGIFSQFQNMSLDEQLKWIVFYTFSYTEGYCLSKDIDILSLAGLKRISSINGNIIKDIHESGRKIDVQIRHRRDLFELGFENILSKEYSIDKE